VATAVVGVAAALGPPGGLDVVEQQDAVVGVEHHRVAELALPDSGRVAQVVERHVLLEAHPEDVLGRAAVDEPREAGQEHEGSGRRLGL